MSHDISHVFSNSIKQLRSFFYINANRYVVKVGNCLDVDLPGFGWVYGRHDVKKSLNL